MEPNRSIVVFSSGPQGNLELLAVGGKKGGRKTTKPAKDSFQVRQQLLLGAGLGQCDEQREKTLMSSVIDANTRASDNMTALKLTQALGDKILWKGVYRGPPVVEVSIPFLLFYSLILLLQLGIPSVSVFLSLFISTPHRLFALSERSRRL